MSGAVPIIGDAASDILLIGDHASDHVPDGVDLGVPPALMREHVAIDIGVAPLGRALCAALGCAGVLGGVSRLVIDLNREEDAAGLIPLASDGHAVPGNAALDQGARADRVARYWRPYHALLAERIARAGRRCWSRSTASPRASPPRRSRGRGRSVSSTIGTSGRRASPSRCWRRPGSRPGTTCLIPARC